TEGDTIRAGQPVCIIEAMKIFNEIESEVSGRVIKILVDNEQPVEFGQTLMVVEPL
nr:acetyl-CoA carboxylase, biotin carboxyl carrier protein [FCB group bacterium]